MADKIDVPGIGGMNKQLVIGGVGIAGAFVIYKWWQSRSSASTGATAAPVIVDPNNPTSGNIPATAQNAPASTDSTFAGVGSPAPTIVTNADWAKACIDYLSGIGFDPTTVATTLGLFLGRQPLTTDQQNIVRTAEGAEGLPPVGGPYPILSTQGNTPPPDQTPPPDLTPPPPVQTTPPPPPPPTARTYTIVRGDTLWSIAGSMYGDPLRWHDIFNANAGLLDSVAAQHGKGNSGGGHWIFPGTTITIP